MSAKVRGKTETTTTVEKKLTVSKSKDMNKSPSGNNNEVGSKNKNGAAGKAAAPAAAEGGGGIEYEEADESALLSTLRPDDDSFVCALEKLCLHGDAKMREAGMKKMEYKTRQWHEKCFSCCVCHTPIGTKSFIPRDQEIYCTGCYEESFATRCIKCNKIITSGGVTYKNEPWHKECFTCTNCTKSLAGERFTSKNEKPYCAECFGELFAKRCTSCAKPITGIGGTRYISFEDRHWHNDCFVCAMCKNSLVGKGFITDGEDILCPECAKQKLM